MKFRGFVLGRLILTWCRQPSGASLVDDSFTVDLEGREYRSKAILLRPWRHNRHGERGGAALVIGWRRPA